MTARSHKKQTPKERNALSVARAAERLAKKTALAAELLAQNVAKTSPSLTKDDVENIVQKSVTQTLASFGIHVRTDEEVDALRADLAYTRAWRLTVQKSTRTGFITLFSVLATGLIGVVWVGIRVALLGHP